MTAGRSAHECGRRSFFSSLLWLAGWLWLRACEKDGLVAVGSRSGDAPCHDQPGPERKSRSCRVAANSGSISSRVGGAIFRFSAGGGTMQGAGRRVALKLEPGRGDGSACFALSRPKGTKMRTRLLRDAVFWGGEKDSSRGHRQLRHQGISSGRAWILQSGLRAAASRRKPRPVCLFASRRMWLRRSGHHLHGWWPAIGPALELTHEAAIGCDDAINQRPSSNSC